MAKKTNKQYKCKKGCTWKVSPLKFMLALYALFVVLYVLIVGTRYGAVFRMMEANSSTDEPFYHLFRYPYIGALLYALLIIAVPLMVGSVWLFKCKRKMSSLTILGSFILAYFVAPHSSTDKANFHLFTEELENEQQVCNYILMADDKRWDELLESLRKDGNLDTPIGMRYALLAESALGRLPDALFHYPVRSATDFLFRGDRSPVTCQFNRQFYENLGVYDEAFHQAMEYGMKQKGGCCVSTLRHLIDYALVQGDWRVAEKYLKVLSEAWFESDFIEQRTSKLKEVMVKMDKAVEANDSTMIIPLRGETFVGLYPLRSEMVRLAYYQEADQQKAVDYLLCIALLEKNLDTFYNVLTQFPNYQSRELPITYQEALELLQSDGRSLYDAPQGTYAYYFHHVQPEIEGADVALPSIN